MTTTVRRTVKVNFGYYSHGSLTALPSFHLGRTQRCAFPSAQPLLSYVLHVKDVNATLNECAHKIVETKVSIASSLFTFRKLSYIYIL